MLKKSLYIILIVYLVALLAVYTFQRKLLYFPADTYVSPQAFSTSGKFKELVVKTQDGFDLKGWYAPASSKNLTLVFFHGNRGSLRRTAFVSEPYIAAGYGFLLAEYRGFGGMPGSPTEQGLYADARAFIRGLIASGVKEKDIVLFGHSLGTGVVTQMAREFNVRGLILFAPYLSIPKIAQIHYPIFPVEYLTKDRYESFKKIPDIHAPILIAHGGRDAIIPPAQGKQLFDLANEPKEFLFIPNAHHNDLLANEFVASSLEWLRTLSPILRLSRSPQLFPPVELDEEY